MISVFIDGAIEALFGLGTHLQWLVVIFGVLYVMYSLVSKVKIEKIYHQSSQTRRDAVNEKRQDMRVIKEYQLQNQGLIEALNYHACSKTTLGDEHE